MSFTLLAVSVIKKADFFNSAFGRSADPLRVADRSPRTPHWATDLSWPLGSFRGAEARRRGSHASPQWWREPASDGRSGYECGCLNSPDDENFI